MHRHDQIIESGRARLLAGHDKEGGAEGGVSIWHFMLQIKIRPEMSADFVHRICGWRRC